MKPQEAARVPTQDFQESQTSQTRVNPNVLSFFEFLFVANAWLQDGLGCTNGPAESCKIAQG
eukprot:8536263-Pyramimonas_sp.AAC.1